MESTKQSGRNLQTKTAGVLLSLLLLCSCNMFANDDKLLEQGNTLLKNHQYAKAEELFQKYAQKQEYELNSLTAKSSIKKKQLEIQAKRVAVGWNNLATAYYGSGKYVEAEEAFLRAITVQRQYFGKQSTFMVNCLNSLAASYYKQGKLFEAERYYIEELEIQKQLLKPSSLSIAITANNLAAIYQKLGDDDNAEKYFQWALNLCKDAPSTPEEENQLADILNNLALFYEKKSNFSDAKDMVQKALELEKKMTGTPGIIDKVRSLLVLAGIEKSFDVDASENHYLEASKIIDTQLASRNDLLCEALEKHAELLLSERRFTEAEPVFRRSLESCEQAHGLSHPSVAERLSEFSLLFRRTGRPEEGGALLRRALSIQEKTIGVDTAPYLSTVHRLAACLADQKRYKEADDLYEEVLPKLKDRLGPDHPFVADTLDNWANYAEQSGKKEQAEELHSQAKMMRRKLAGSLKSPLTSEPNLKSNDGGKIQPTRLD